MKTSKIYHPPAGAAASHGWHDIPKSRRWQSGGVSHLRAVIDTCGVKTGVFTASGHSRLLLCGKPWRRAVVKINRGSIVCSIEEKKQGMLWRNSVYTALECLSGKDKRSKSFSSNILNILIVYYPFLWGDHLSPLICPKIREIPSDTCICIPGDTVRWISVCLPGKKKATTKKKEEKVSSHVEFAGLPAAAKPEGGKWVKVIQIFLSFMFIYLYNTFHVPVCFASWPC